MAKKGVNSPDGVNMLNANKDVDIRKQKVYSSRGDLLNDLPNSKRAIGYKDEYLVDNKPVTGIFVDGITDDDFLVLNTLIIPTTQALIFKTKNNGNPNIIETTDYVERFVTKLDGTEWIMKGIYKEGEMEKYESYEPIDPKQLRINKK